MVSISNCVLRPSCPVREAEPVGTERASSLCTLRVIGTFCLKRAFQVLEDSNALSAILTCHVLAAIKAGQKLPVMNVSADLLKQVVDFGTKNLSEAKKSPEEIPRVRGRAFFADSPSLIQWLRLFG